MPVIRNEYPILEYDSDPGAILTPTHEGLDLRLPEKAVFPFLGETVQAYARSHSLTPVTWFRSITKDYPVYVFEDRGEALCLCQAPAGASAAVQVLDWLIGYGVRKAVSAGSCGALVPLAENELLIPERALRDEGTSYHYLPPSRFIDLAEEAITAALAVLSGQGYPARRCTTWTTDGFFRETRDMTALRVKEGCEVVEMECAALAACAKKRGALFAQLLYTGDTLAAPEAYDARHWGGQSMQRALSLCFDIIHAL